MYWVLFFVDCGECVGYFVVVVRFFIDGLWWIVIFWIFWFCLRF